MNEAFSETRTRTFADPPQSPVKEGFGPRGDEDTTAQIETRRNVDLRY